MPLIFRPRSTRPIWLSALIAALALLTIPAARSAAAETSVLGWGLPAKVGFGTSLGSGNVAPTVIPGTASSSAAALGVTDAFLVTPSGVLAAGYGSYLGLGLGAVAQNAAIPFTLIPGTAGASAVAAGGSGTTYPEFSLILKGDGTVLGFGGNKTGANGHLPTTSPPTTTTPTPIAGLNSSVVTAIAAGVSDALALEADGTVWNWGEREILGNLTAAGEPGTFTNVPAKVELPSEAGRKAIAIAAGGYHSLALLEDGSVYTWGYNESGQLGNGAASATSINVPVQVIPPPSGSDPHVVAISASLESSFALYSDGTFKAWGLNDKGQLGLGLGSGNTTVNAPTAPGAAATAHAANYPALTQISSLSKTTYAIVGGTGANKGQVLVWGENAGGKFGFGAATPSYEFAFPYVNAAGTAGQGATEVPQRLGRLKGVSWLGVGVSGSSEIAPSEATLRFFSGLLSNPAFFSHAVGTLSAPQGVEIQSVGDPTTITSVKVVGPNRDDFKIDSYALSTSATDAEEQLPLTVAAGDRIRVKVRFNPSDLGERSATLQVQGAGETASVQLSGYGTELPGNTPGPQGEKGGPGPAGPPGPAGKDGVVVFAATRAKVSARRGRTASLGFLLVNGTSARLAGTTIAASVPSALGSSAKGETRIAPLPAGSSRQVRIQLKIGARAQLGAHPVRVTFRAGGKVVVRTVSVQVAN